MKYYVYTHELRGVIFYVGKGQGNRFVNFKSRSKEWIDYVNGCETDIICQKIFNTNDEEEALRKENELIIHFKETLVNKKIDKGVVTNPFCFDLYLIDNNYFDATLLLNSFNALNENDKKLMSNYTKLSSTKDFVEYLKKYGVSEPLITSTKGTFMDMKVFIDFAMWLSVEFKSKIIDWLLSGGKSNDYYNEMCATIMEVYIETKGCKPPPTVYINEALMLKELVGVSNRNEATEKQLKNLTILQKVNATLIKEGIGKVSRFKQLTTIINSIR